MSETRIDDEQQWLTTYELVTADRILGRYKISVPTLFLLSAIKNPISFYHKLIQVPIKNVLNGIIMQQTHDYHVYVQKIFIDYLLSGESGKSPEEQGASTREELEQERVQLVASGELFNKLQLDHECFIGSTQATLIQLTREWNECYEAAIKNVKNALGVFGLVDITKSQIRHAIVYALIHCVIDAESLEETSAPFIVKMNEILKKTLPQDLGALMSSLSPLLGKVVEINTKVSEFLSKNEEIHDQAKTYRQQFYDTTVRVIALIQLLSDYKIDPVQDAINRESLYFDNTIGA